MKRKDALSRLRAAEKAIRACGVAHLFLFGSVARDEARDRSDIDVFIDRDPGQSFSLIKLSGLHHLLENVLGASVDVGTRRGLHPAIRADVEKTAIQVFWSLGRDALLRLQDMRESIETAFRLIAGVEKRNLDQDEARHSACLYRVLVVAEAAKALPQPLRQRHPNIPWSELIGMGDMLRHQYFRIEADVVWETIAEDFPALLETVKRMLAEEMEEVGADS